MELPPFPRDFSKQARANVFAVEIVASEAVAQAKEPQHALRSGVFPGNRMSGVVVQYIMSVFAPFAHEACELGRKPDAWGVDTVDRESREFLRLLISNAKAHYSLPIFRLPEMLSHFNASILASFQAIVELTDEWKRYQQELLDVAELQMANVTAIPQLQYQEPRGPLRIMQEEDAREMARIPARQREQRQTSGESSPPTEKTAKASKRNRLSKTIKSDIAARRLEAFLDASPIEKTVFARNAGTTERTLLRFRRSGRINRQTLGEIAREMGTTLEELIKP